MIHDDFSGLPVIILLYGMIFIILQNAVYNFIIMLTAPIIKDAALIDINDNMTAATAHNITTDINGIIIRLRNGAYNGISK